MTKAQLVQRIVKGPKPIHGYDEKGLKHLFQIGETISLTPNAAKRFAKYLTTPEMAAAQKLLDEAELKAAKEAKVARAGVTEAEGAAAAEVTAAGDAEIPKPTGDEVPDDAADAGGDSLES